MSLVLYSNVMWNSPYVLSAFVALTEKKLPFEVKTVALHEGAQRAPSYVETSFTARVPALVDGAFSLSESSAIVEYIDGGSLFGAWSIADTDLAMMLQRLVKTHQPLPARLKTFAEREWQRPSVQAFVTARRPPHQPAQVW